MQTNPLMNRSFSGGRVDEQMLQDYVDRLNGMGFTREMGWRWLIGRRRNADGSEIKFLDRIDQVRPA